MKAARMHGVNVSGLDPWRLEADFDILHLWGLDLQHKHTAQWAHRANKRVVISALLDYNGWKSLTRHVASLILGPARLRRKMISCLDALTVVNRAQAKYAHVTTGLSFEKIAVIPNIVDDVFYMTEGQVNSFSAPDFRDYVVCTGNISRRKNQLALVHACRQLGVPLILIGKALTGEDDYGLAVKDAMRGNPQMRWVEGFPPGSIELAAAYHFAAIFALPSYGEQQPISALEAAAAGKPLVLADRPYAKQEYYGNAALVDPASVDSIATGLRRALNKPQVFRPPREIIEQCRMSEVGRAYAAIYERIA